MKKMFYLLSIAAVFSMAACKKSNCDQECQNGGTCVDGKCKCTADFTGADCTIHTNPCDTIVCYNGGTCLSGACICPAHTSGVNCQQLEQPSGFWINKVGIAHFSPADQQGHTWDWDTDGTPADIYPIIKRNGTIIYNGHAQNIDYAYKENANYDTWYPMPFYPDSIFISDVTNPEYRIELWDYDDGINDDFMDGYNFTPFTGDRGFPGSVTLTDTSMFHQEFEFSVYFSSYQW